MASSGLVTAHLGPNAAEATTALSAGLGPTQAKATVVVTEGLYY
jgi:hypothetical protein